MTQDQKKEALKLWISGKSKEEIAKALNVEFNTLIKEMKHFNIN